MLIGKLVGVEALGIYNLSKQLVLRPGQVINPIVTQVAFPVMAKLQNDLTRLKSIYLKMISYLTSLNSIIYMFMIFLANLLVPLILGESWVGAIKVFQVLSVYALIRSWDNPAGSLLLARGRADIGFVWSIFEFIIVTLAVFIGSHWSVVGIAFSLLIYQAIFSVLNWKFIVNKMFSVPILEYLNCIVPPLASAVFAVKLVDMIMSRLSAMDALIIPIYIFLSLVLYILFLYFGNRRLIIEMYGLIKNDKMHARKK